MMRDVAQPILLLDDDATFRGLVTPALQQAGFEVVEAPKGKVALELLAEHDFAVLIVDGLLPDTNGMRWIEKVRAEGADVPIVFVSAFYRDLASYKKLKDVLGVAEVIHKPVDPAAFATRVRRHARGRRRERTSTLDLDVADIEEFLLEESDAGDTTGTGEDFVLFDPEPESSAPSASEEALRASYADVLPQILELFLRATDRARRKPDSSHAVDEAIRQAHEIAGTAGSYGYAEIGHCATVVEAELRKVQARQEVDWRAFDRAVAAVRALPLVPTAAPDVAAETSSDATAPTLPAQPGPDPGRFTPLSPTMAQVKLPRTGSQRALPASAVGAFASRVLGPRIGVVDDDPELSEYLRDALSGSFASLVPFTEMDTVRHAHGLEAAIVSVPFGTPDRSAEVIEVLRSRMRSLPIAVLAMEDSFESRLVQAQSGADVFLAHPLDEREVRRAVRRLESLVPGRPRVLLFDVADPIERALQGLEFVHVRAPDALVPVLARQRPHVVVLGKGHGALGKVVRMADGGDLVALLLAESALDEGIDATLDGPSAFETVVRHGQRVFARQRTTTDFLTGLPPRSELVRALQARLSETRRRAHGFTVALLEIDGFDALVQREGSAFAERVANAFARLLAARLRVEDVRGRWGGGLCIAGFADAMATDVAPTVQRIQQEAMALGFQGRQGAVRCSLCAGLASAPDAADSLADLVLVAEGRLRLAQRAGEGKIVWTG